MGCQKMNRRVLRLKPNFDFDILYENDFKDTTKLLQYAVDGRFQLFYYFRKLEKEGIDTFCNEEFLFRNDLMPTLILLNKYSRDIVGEILGNIVFVRYDDEGEMIDLKDEDIKMITDMFLNLKNEDDETFHFYGLYQYLPFKSLGLLVDWE